MFIQDNKFPYIGITFIGKHIKLTEKNGNMGKTSIGSWQHFVKIIDNKKWVPNVHYTYNGRLPTLCGRNTNSYQLKFTGNKSKVTCPNCKALLTKIEIKMIKYHETEIPLYSGRLIIVFTDNIENLTELYSKKFLTKNGIWYIRNFFAHAIDIGNKDNREYMILINTNRISEIDVGIMAHEALHITNMLMQDVGNECSRKNDETDAYLLEWVVDKLFQAMKIEGYIKFY